MAAENSFDIVSKVDVQEVRNAIEQAIKEVRARFDLKDSKSEIKLEGSDTIELASADDYKLKAVTEILQQKLVKRGSRSNRWTTANIEPAVGLERSPKDHAAARHPRGESQGNRQAGQGLEEEGPGLHPRRYRAHHGKGSRYSTGDDRAAEGSRSSASTCSSPTIGTN